MNNNELITIIHDAMKRRDNNYISIGELIKYNEALQKKNPHYYGTFDFYDIYSCIISGSADYSLETDKEDNWIIKYNDEANCYLNRQCD